MDSYTKIEELLCMVALELIEPAQRKAFLDRACGGDARLREAVEEMLAVHADAEDFFDQGKQAVNSVQRDILGAKIEAGVPPSVEADALIGSHVGRYKLLQRLGEGGCGTVYMAEQEEPIRRRVAVKVIKAGMDTKSVIARFEAERQALAMMDHPNIARVLDAAATESGRPYFVMELVRGVRITKYCDENSLDSRQRLGLFIKVCQAIQHAHQKGIIHRDIKPSNILVTLQDGVAIPKVIDFGIAKAVEGRLTDKTLFTAYEHFIGTPAYMSPEQAELSSVDVDTRSDVYSLGVLLYELLTGRTPFDGQALLRAGLEAMRKTLLEKEPLTPSNMVASLSNTELATTALCRQAAPPRLISQLKGDLDWIVMKALEKDRARRYETVDGLAMDVQRYLDNEPVIARAPSQIYRLRKLIRRNKVIFASGTAVGVALIAGLTISTWLFFRERAAHREQVYLREQAEQSNARENVLREQAEAREKIDQAAFHISQGRYDDANRLLGMVGTPPPRLNIDGVEAYRTVGTWLALQGRWDESAARFFTLMEIAKLDNWHPTPSDYQACGALLMESGRTNQYTQFRRIIVGNMSNLSDGIADGGMLRTCLLLPPDKRLLRQMKPIAGAQLAYCNRLARPEISGWEWLPAALWLYRTEDYATAAQWCRDKLGTLETNSNQAAVLQTILAMSCFRLGQANEARGLLPRVCTTVMSRFQNGMAEGDQRNGVWSDWLQARILLREAMALAGDAGIPAGVPDPHFPIAALRQNADGSITLRAVRADLHGGLRYEIGEGKDNIGFWTSPDRFVSWTFQMDKPGRFQVAVETSGDNGRFEIYVGEQKIFGDAPFTGGYMRFKMTKLNDVLEIPARGMVTLYMKPVKENWSFINLRSVTLTPLDEQASHH